HTSFSRDWSSDVCSSDVLGGLLPSLAAPLDLPWPLSGFGIALFAGVAMRALVWVGTAALVHGPDRPRVDGAVLREGLRSVPAVRSAERRVAEGGGEEGQV